LACRTIKTAVGYTLRVTGEALAKPLEKTSETPQLAVTPERAGSLQWRCRVADGKGNRSTWGEEQSLAVVMPPEPTPPPKETGVVAVETPPPPNEEPQEPLPVLVVPVAPAPLLAPRLAVGATMGVVTDFDQTGSLLASAELVYRVARPTEGVELGVSAKLAYFRAGVRSRAGLYGSQHTVPTSISGELCWPRPLVSPFVELGVVAAWMQARLERTGSTPLVRSRLGAGVVAGAGLSRPVAFGEVVLALRGYWLRGSDAWFDYNGMGLSPTVGYRLQL
jgi:hypothetical protein